MLNAESTRRDFIGRAAALAAVGTAGYPLDAFAAPARWYKGMLHSHTFWSDGKAFPEEAITWYKSRGYHFYGMSDHNVFQDDAARWVGIIANDITVAKRKNPGTLDYRYFPNVKRRYFEDYVRSFPDADTRTAANGRTEVRLKTFDELSRKFNKSGEFLLLPDVEATRSVTYSDGRVHQLHMNYVNLPALLPSFLAKDFNRYEKDISFSAFLGTHAREAATLARRLGRPHLFILNHPIWTWYDVGPEVLVDNPDVRFFEVCNNGSPYGPGESLPADGLDTDRFWDVVNAFRARRGHPLLYGIGTDDTHNYRGEPGKMLMPGNAWTLVRATSLDAASLIAAMGAGDFVTCEGLEPEDVTFDQSAGCLEVRVAGVPGKARTIRFIVSKKDFSEKPLRTVEVRPTDRMDNKFLRRINVYDAKIGLTAKTVEGRAGEPICATYTLADDDLYVRARIEEQGQPLCSAPLHPQGLHAAWTQPYRRA